MRKYFILTCFFILFCAVSYGINIDFSWSLGEIGIENTNFETKINSFFSVLNFYWMERNTGLGIGVSLFNIHSYYDDHKYVFLKPLEIMWHPFYSRLGRFGRYGTLGIYNKTIMSSIATSGWINSTGLRYIISTQPFGRGKDKRRSKYNFNTKVYVEFSTDKTWRMGITAEYLYFGTILLYPIKFLREKPIEE